MTQTLDAICTEAKGRNPATLYFHIALKFFKNIQFYFKIFQIYSNFIFYPLMEYLTTEILYYHPNQKHVTPLDS